MKRANKDSTLKDIILFWLPLAATWLMMAIEQPYLSSIIARLDQPVVHLAAFGIAYSFALIFEAPIIMILSAVTALVHDQVSYHKLLRFTRTLNLIVSLAMVVIILPPVFNWLSQDLLHLPAAIKSYTHTALLLLLPWPSAIGIRRFYQGVLIVTHKTRRVAYGTIIRLISMSLTAIVLFILKMPGAITAAASLSSGVVAEAIATRWMARAACQEILSKKVSLETREPLSTSGVIKFYTPLALTSFLSLAIHPLTVLFMSKGKYPLESLAVLPVVNSLVFLFRCFGLSIHEVVITFVHLSWQTTQKTIRFAQLLGGSVLVGMSLIAFTPLNSWWFHTICGLEDNLANIAYLPTQILVVLPALTVLISFQRGVLVKAQATSCITTASIIEIVLIIFALWIFIGPLQWIGAVAAAAAYIVGRLGANLYLWPKVNKHL